MSLVVLISGRGSNLRAILHAPVGEKVSAVISDNPHAAGLEIARAQGKPVHVVNRDDYAVRGDFEQALAAKIKHDEPRLIALAGFMRVLSAAFVAAHHGRLINIHPSLLPAFPGLHTHRRALAAGVREHGCTVHWVNEEIDGGKIIAQERVVVLPDDTEETLAERVLEQEHLLYPQVLSALLK